METGGVALERFLVIALSKLNQANRQPREPSVESSSELLTE